MDRPSPLRDWRWYDVAWDAEEEADDHCGDAALGVRGVVQSRSHCPRLLGRDTSPQFQWEGLTSGMDHMDQHPEAWVHILHLEYATQCSHC